jgi:AraC family transcriptional activator of pobA
VALLCLKLAGREEDQLYQSLLKDSINSLVGLVISMYLDQGLLAENISRTELVAKSFRETLATHFLVLKRPAA